MFFVSKHSESIFGGSAAAENLFPCYEHVSINVRAMFNRAEFHTARERDLAAPLGDTTFIDNWARNTAGTIDLHGSTAGEAFCVLQQYMGAAGRLGSAVLGDATELRIIHGAGTHSTIPYDPALAEVVSMFFTWGRMGGSFVLESTRLLGMGTGFPEPIPYAISVNA